MNGWKAYGNTNLFQWDATNANLRVTWDSSQTNSYFYHPLGTILAKDDDFRLAFDLRVDDIGPGPDPAKPYTFQVAVGFLNFDQARQPAFLRGSGFDSPNLVEFDYFWDSGFGATVWPTFISTNSQFNYHGSSDYAILTLTAGDWHRVVMTYTASNRTLVTALTNLASNSGITLAQPLTAFFSDYRVDTVSISSFSDAGQDPMFAGSILADGVIDNVSVTVPPPPAQILAGAFTNGAWRVEFANRTNWLYTLERSPDLQSWTGVSAATPGVPGVLSLSDTNPPAGNAFYRVRANRP